MPGTPADPDAPAAVAGAAAAIARTTSSRRSAPARSSTFAPAPAPPSPADLALAARRRKRSRPRIRRSLRRQALAQVAARRGGPGWPRRARRPRCAAPATPPTSPRCSALTASVPPAITGDEEFFTLPLQRGARPSSPTCAPEPKRARRCRRSRSATSRSPSTSTTRSRSFPRSCSKNVVGMVEGSDPKLKDTYVFFGAHLDHVGYRTAATAGAEGGGGARPRRAGARSDLQRRRRRRIGIDGAAGDREGVRDRAEAEAIGRSSCGTPAKRPACSGSRYMADFPVVPLEKVQAQFNIDMIGRNRDDDPTAGQHGVRDRRRSHQHRPPQPGRGHEHRRWRSRSRSTTSTTIRPIRTASTPAAITTATRRRAFRSRSSSPARTPTTTAAGDHGGQDPVSRSWSAIAQMVYQSGFSVANTERTLDAGQPRARGRGRGFPGGSRSDVDRYQRRTQAQLRRTFERATGPSSSVCRARSGA